MADWQKLTKALAADRGAPTRLEGNVADWRQAAKALALADGRIDDREAAVLRRELIGDERIDRAEVEFLLEVRREARGASKAFRELVHHALKAVMLRDGRIGESETAWLRPFILRDNRVTEEEVWFLRELQLQAKEVCPEFEALLEDCLENKAPHGG
jgi:hypothetical protein